MSEKLTPAKMSSSKTISRIQQKSACTRISNRAMERNRRTEYRNKARLDRVKDTETSTMTVTEPNSGGAIESQQPNWGPGMIQANITQFFKPHASKNRK